MNENKELAVWHIEPSNDLGLSHGIIAHMAEAAAVCLKHNKHDSTSCELRLKTTDYTCHTQAESPKYIINIFKLIYQNPTQQMLNSHGDLQVATEFGACYITFRALRATTEYCVLRQSPKDGGGFDYYLVRLGNEDPNDTFGKTARMEISGILDDPKKLKSRLKRKERQTSVSDGSGLPKFISVVEFFTPIIEMLHK